MSTDLRDAFRSAAAAVPPMGDVEQAVRRGRRRRRATVVAAPLALLVLIAGVWLAVPEGVTEPPVAEPQPRAVTAADLAGRTFAATDGLPEDQSLVLTFRRAVVTVYADAGPSEAAYQIVDDVLRLEQEWYACGVCGGSWLRDLFSSGPTVQLAGGELSLTAAEGPVTMTELDVPTNTEVRKATWNLNSYALAGDSAGAVAVPEAVYSSLQIEGSAMSVEYGCNHRGGGVLVTEQTLELVGSWSATRLGCSGPTAVVESAVMQVLLPEQRRISYRIEGTVLRADEAATLTLSSAGGQLVYTNWD